MTEIISDALPLGAAVPRHADGLIDLQALLRALAESAVNEIMSARADLVCGQTGNSRNGCREREPKACVGSLTLRVPKLRPRSFFPDEVIKHRSRCVQAFPSEASRLRLVGAVMCDRDEAWSSSRCVSEARMAELYDGPAPAAGTPCPAGLEEARATIEAGLVLADSVEAA